MDGHINYSGWTLSKTFESCLFSLIAELATLFTGQATLFTGQATLFTGQGVIVNTWVLCFANTPFPVWLFHFIIGVLELIGPAQIFDAVSVRDRISIVYTTYSIVLHSTKYY